MRGSIQGRGELWIDRISRIFTATLTAVIEFIFLADPPLMFWNLAAAVGQQYWMLPVPEAYWMQKQMQVCQGGICRASHWGQGVLASGGRGKLLWGGPPASSQPLHSIPLMCNPLPCPPQVPIGEVLDVLTAVLPASVAAVQPTSPTCPPGSYLAQSPARCMACSAGSYAFNSGSSSCRPCPGGQYAAAVGSTACRTCQPGTYSSPNGAACLSCPTGEPLAEL